MTDLFCVIDLETTPYEIWQVECIPLNSTFMPLQGADPFEIVIRPDKPEKCDRQLMQMSEKELERVLQSPETQETASKKFHDYCLNLIKNYGQSKITPVGQSWVFDCEKLQLWIGNNNLFHSDYVDPSVMYRG